MALFEYVHLELSMLSFPSMIVYMLKLSFVHSLLFGKWDSLEPKQAVKEE